MRATTTCFKAVLELSIPLGWYLGFTGLNWDPESGPDVRPANAECEIVPTTAEENPFATYGEADCPVHLGLCEYSQKVDINWKPTGSPQGVITPFFAQKLAQFMKCFIRTPACGGMTPSNMVLQQNAIPSEIRILERERTARSEVPLSEALWDIRWTDHLPRTVTADGVTVVVSSFAQALPFIEGHYAEIFQEDPACSPFLSSKITSAKSRYYSRVGDFFEFRHEDNTVGLLIGTPVDWSSYYLRSAAALPEYQGKKVVQRFFPILFEVLKDAGVERVEADTSPANMATLQLLTRLRFNVTGTVMSERWGSHVHLTKFLDNSSEEVFLRQFCAGVKYQLRERH